MFFKKFRNTKPEPELRMFPENYKTVKLLPKELLTSHAVYSINRTIIDGGALVTLRNGEEILSLAVMRYLNNELIFSYIATMPQHLHKGYAGELFHRLLAVSDKSKSITAHLENSGEYCPYVKKLLLKEGFKHKADYTTYTASIDSIVGCEDSETLKRIHRLYERANRDGFELISFADADNDLLEQVRCSKTNAFRNTLDPKTIFSDPDYIMRELSFILAKDGDVAAYSIISERDDGSGTAEFDHLAASEKYRSSGLAIFPAYASFEKIRACGKYKNIMWQIVGVNKDSSDMISQMLSCEKHETKLETFFLPPRKSTAH